jgi:hypothetical protein
MEFEWRQWLALIDIGENLEKLDVYELYTKVTHDAESIFGNIIKNGV